MGDFRLNVEDMIIEMGNIVRENRYLRNNSQSAIEVLNKENEALKSEIEKLKSATKTTIEPTKERKKNKKEVSEKDITILEKLFPTYKFSNELRADIIRHHCPSEYEYYNSDCPNDAECNFLGSCDECWNRPCSDFTIHKP